MKKIIVLSTIFILATFLSLSNAVADGKRHQNERGAITQSDNWNHNHAYNNHYNGRDHRYIPNPRYNSWNHRYNTPNNRYNSWNQRYTLNPRYDRWNHRYNSHNNRYNGWNHRSNRHWTRQ